MRRFMFAAVAAATFAGTTAVHPSAANAAVIYCKAVGVPKGCIARAPVATAVVTPGVGAPGVGVRPGTPANRGGPVNRVGRR